MPKYVKVSVYADGGCRGNPGVGAIGVVIINPKEEKLVVHGECVGETTNNRAEYKALIQGLELATDYCQDQVQCFCDSELVIKQASGRYAIKQKELLELFHILKNRERAFNKVTYNHLPRGNRYLKIADSLLNRALNAKPKTEFDQGAKK